MAPTDFQIQIEKCHFETKTLVIVRLKLSPEINVGTAVRSNKSTKRLHASDRVPSANRVSIAVLPGYRLSFQKKSSDGSAKCDAYFTGNKSDSVIGVLFEVNQSEKTNLDRTKGLGFGYKEKKSRS
jgi:hypothetical protein